SEEHTSELQSLTNLVCRLLLEKENHPRTTLVNGQSAASCITVALHLRARRAPAPARPCLLGRPPVRTLAPRVLLFFFNDPAPAEIYPLPLHDALPISRCSPSSTARAGQRGCGWRASAGCRPREDRECNSLEPSQRPTAYGCLRLA